MNSIRFRWFCSITPNVLRLAAVRFPAFDRRTTVSVHCVSVHEGRSALQQALLLATVNYYI